MMQKEVQRFMRDIVRIVAEITSEQFTLESLRCTAASSYRSCRRITNSKPRLQFSRVSNRRQTRAKFAIDQFKAAYSCLKNERERCAKIGIETDSTILPDEEKERKDRLEFLGQIGAFMQQAAPTAQAYPQMAAC
jgi:hypothetical protein